jgi:hypothetical protein
MNDEVVGQLWKLIIPGYRNVRGTASYERYWLIRKLVFERAMRDCADTCDAPSVNGDVLIDTCGDRDLHLVKSLAHYGIDPASWALAEGVTGHPLDGEQS